MPSPFPGMDPYLEDPARWPDFHDRFAEEASARLNLLLPKPYFAQLGVREEIGVIGEGALRRVIPAPAGNVAVLDDPRTDVGASVEVIMDLDVETVNYIEIRDAHGEHEVVTVIEILSPSNKNPGEQRVKYQQKRTEVLESNTSLIEIDLLRGGDRSWYGPEICGRIYEFSPTPEYLVLINRAWKRGRSFSFQLFPAYLQAPLPVITVPLREGEPEPTLDLQFVFQQTYNRGPYGRVVDYSGPLLEPLPPELQNWAAECVRRYLSGTD